MSIPGTYSSMMMSSGTTPSLVGVGAFSVINSAGGVPQTIALPSGVLSGDYIIVVYQNSDRNTATCSLTSIQSVTGTGHKLSMAGDVYSGGSAPTITVSGNLQAVAFCIALRGVSSVDASLTSTSSSMSAGSGNSVSNVTSLVSNTYIVTALGHDLTTSSSSIFSAWANADLEGITELGERSTTFSDDGGLVAVGGLKQAVGATSNTTFTSSNADTGMAKISVSFKG